MASANHIGLREDPSACEVNRDNGTRASAHHVRPFVCGGEVSSGHSQVDVWIGLASRRIQSYQAGIGDHPDSASRDVEMPLIRALTNHEALYFARLGIHPQHIVGAAGWVRVAAPHDAATGADPLAQPGGAEPQWRTSVDLSGSITATEPLSVFTNKSVPSSAIQSGAPVTVIFVASISASVTASGGGPTGTTAAADSLEAPESPGPPGSPLHAERTAATTTNAVRICSCRDLAPSWSSLPQIPAKGLPAGPFQVYKAGSCRRLERICLPPRAPDDVASGADVVDEADALSGERY